MRKGSRLFAFILCFLVSPFSVLATDYTSPHFILRDPLLSGNGAVSATSASFQYFSSTDQIGPGESAGVSRTSLAGFLYFSVATSPVLSGVAGDAQVRLNWTASGASLGAQVASYAVGQSLTAGGPYNYSDVGLTLSSVRGGLSNGTAYRFVVQARDADGSPLALSNEISVTPIPAGGNGGAGGGAGGNGGGVPITAVTLSGRAYPSTKVYVLKDSQIAVVTVAGPDSLFSVTISGLSSGNYFFGLYAEDANGRRSSLLTFPISLTQGTSTNVSGIFLSPTLAIDKSQVKLGDTLSLFGQSTPDAEITIQVNSDQTFFQKTTADANGVYLKKFDTSVLEKGDHSTKSKAAINDQEISPYGLAINFKVGDTNVDAPNPDAGSCGRADLNCDRHVNLVDFSIAAFWYQKKLSASFAAIEAERLNADGKINLVDFSIMAYYWSG